MKIICTQENLKNGLVITGRVSSSTNTLPILNNLLLSTENGQLKISSTNLEIAVNTYVRCKIEQEGAVTVGSKTITELINNLPNQNITLEGVIVGGGVTCNLGPGQPSRGAPGCFPFHFWKIVASL